jgi:hypothetical protein
LAALDLLSGLVSLMALPSVDLVSLAPFDLPLALPSAFTESAFSLPSVFTDSDWILPELFLVSLLPVWA